MSGATASPTASAFKRAMVFSTNSVVNPFGHHEPGRRGAALAGRVESALDRALDRDVEIGIVEHQERVLPAHLQLHFGVALRSREKDVVSRLDGPGEADRVDVGRGDEDFTDDCVRGR